MVVPGLANYPSPEQDAEHLPSGCEPRTGCRSENGNRRAASQDYITKHSSEVVVPRGTNSVPYGARGLCVAPYLSARKRQGSAYRDRSMLRFSMGCDIIASCVRQRLVPSGWQARPDPGSEHTRADQMTHTPKPRKGRWLALGAVLLGLLYVTVGIWALSRSSERMAASYATATPPSMPTSTVKPDQGAGASTPTPPLATPAPATTSAPLPTATRSSTSASVEGTFSLHVVHTNDTWGYTLPCG